MINFLHRVIAYICAPVIVWELTKEVKGISNRDKGKDEEIKNMQNC